METRRAERIKQLSLALKNADKLHVKQAAALLGVSEMTVRRDLSASHATVTLLGGYVVADLRHGAATRYSLTDQQTQRLPEKRRIGALAAALINSNDTVFFDCGTTTPAIIDAIDDSLPFTAICHALNTFLALQSKPNCRVILCGGSFNPANAIFSSLGQHSELDHICPTLAFISAAGLSLQHGATCFNFDELAMKHRAIRMAQQNILVADHSKFGVEKAAVIAPLLQFEQVITDRSPNAEFSDFFTAHGIALHC